MYMKRAPRGARFLYLPLPLAGERSQARQRLAGSGVHSQDLSPASWRKPGPSDSSAQRCPTSMSFPRRPTARVTFLSGKVTKSIRAGRDGLADIVSARLPLFLASRAPARTRTSLCSNNRAFPARSTSSLRHRDSAQSSLRHGHPWPAHSSNCGLSLAMKPQKQYHFGTY